MIKLYSSPTPNGLKVSLLLEELDVKYEYNEVNLKIKEHKEDKFLKLNPNGKIPVIEDGGVTLFESGAILEYINEKHDDQFLSSSSEIRSVQRQWLFWQVAHLGPKLGNYFSYKYFIRPRNKDSLERFSTESQDALKTLNDNLSDKEFITEEYSIADMALIPWLVSFYKVEPEWIKENVNILKYLKNCFKRKAVQNIFPDFKF